MQRNEWYAQREEIGNEINKFKHPLALCYSLLLVLAAWVASIHLIVGKDKLEFRNLNSLENAAVYKVSCV